ncbi:MAG: outer membrane beta-barrel protein [Lentimicrobiaceae bacterium]|nr:outer membrane beta-barrel protein [Lentimicrobiaceae bacterium]
MKSKILFLTAFLILPVFSANATPNTPKLKLGAQAGYGYSLAPIAETDYLTMENHFKKLKHKLNFGADFSYYFTKYIGVGIKYNGSVAHAVTDDIAEVFKGYHQLSELVDIHYFAPLIATQYFIVPKKHCIFANVGAGYLLYNNKAMLAKKTGNYLEKKEIENTTKHSAAFFAEIGYDFLVTKYFAIGLHVSALLELTNVKLNDPENLSQISVALGFRFYK